MADLADSADSEEAGFYPELPFELGEDFLEEIRKYLVEEEGMDEKDEQALTIAVMAMAEDLCEMSMADEDPVLDDEIASEMIERMTPYVEAQEKWEAQQGDAAAEEREDSDAAESEADVPWIDEAGGWDTPGEHLGHLTRGWMQCRVPLLTRPPVQRGCPCRTMCRAKP